MNTYDKPPGRSSWFTVSELAHFLGQHPNTVRRLVANGTYPDAQERTPHGWKIWAPAQVTEILRIRAR